MYTVENADKPGRAKPLLALDNVIGGQLSPDGTKLAFVRGTADWPRIGYRGTANADIWIYELATKQFKQVTEFEGKTSGRSGSPIASHSSLSQNAMAPTPSGRPASRVVGQHS